MNQETAHEIVEKLIVAIQRFRSMNDEELGEIYADISAELLPWMMGKPGLLPTLFKMAERQITAGEMHNILYVAHHLEPQMSAVYGIVQGEELPYPDLERLMNLNEEIEK